MNKKNIMTDKGEVVSMFFGLGIVILVVVIIFNFVIRNKGNISIPGININLKEQLSVDNNSVVEGDDTYVVVKGDSLWKIAESKYGDGNMWVKIADKNNLKKPFAIEIGQKLSIADVKVNSVAVADTYQVVRGDSLWKIATAQYNDGYKWVNIWNLNKDKIKNSNELEVGMIIKLR